MLCYVSEPEKVVKMLSIAMTCEIVRGIKILNNTTQYCLILHSIAQYCPIFFHIVQYCQILSSNVQYCPVLLYIIRLAILAFFRSSFYDVMSEPLVTPIIGVRLRYRSKWEMCSDFAPICSVLVKHKGYYLWKKSEPMILWYLSANI